MSTGTLLSSPAASGSGSASPGRSPLESKVIVFDEPVSVLDVSVQAGVINLLAGPKATLGRAYLFVSHDLSVIRHIADRVVAMYLGRIIEIGDTDQVSDAPSHPYTQALLSAVPLPDRVRSRHDGESFCPTTCPIPTIRRPVAGSTAAARRSRPLIPGAASAASASCPR
jgi:ABC-type oligopeptide transport system ATPase subunit